jgi:hypothetical protein
MPPWRCLDNNRRYALYLAFSNSLRRTMEALSLSPTAGKPADPLAELHAHIRRGEAA